MNTFKKTLGEYNDSGLLRIESIQPLLLCMAMSSEMNDLLEDLRSYNQLKKLFGARYASMYEGGNKELEYMDDREINESLLQDLCGPFEGKLVAQVYTPIFDGNAFSWGYTTGTWVLGNDLEDILKQGLVWVEKEREYRKTKSVKKKAKAKSAVRKRA
jgi:hypothetical protein